jgi:predicted amidophosphoribosyltransferase
MDEKVIFCVACAKQLEKNEHTCTNCGESYRSTKGSLTAPATKHQFAHLLNLLMEYVIELRA